MNRLAVLSNPVVSIPIFKFYGYITCKSALNTMNSEIQP